MKSASVKGRGWCFAPAFRAYGNSHNGFGGDGPSIA
jgi:hypothetical protein